MKTSFITSYLTFYLKGTAECDGNFVKFSTPNTILKLVPMGSNKQTFPIEQVSSVTTDFRVTLGSLAWGVLFAIVGLACFGSSFLLGLILLAYGALTVLSSLQTAVRITAAGNNYLLPIIFLQKAKAEEIADAIQQAIASRYSDTNVRVHSEKSTDRIVDAIESMKK